MCITSQLTFECSIIRMRIYASSIRNTIQLITCLSSRGNSRILTTTKNSVSSWNVGRHFTNDSRLVAVLQDQGSWYTASWSHKRKTFFPQSSLSPARRVSMRWININVSHQHPINTVLSYIIWKIWWDLTDFRVSNDFFLFFFFSFSDRFWHSDVFGWLYCICSLCKPIFHAVVREAGAPSLRFAREGERSGGSGRADDRSASLTACTNGWAWERTWGTRPRVPIRGGIGVRKYYC